MNKGAYWAGSPLRADDDVQPDPIESVAAIDLSDLHEEPEEVAELPRATIGERIVLGLLGLAAFAWIAVIVGLAVSSFTKGPLDIAGLVRGISLASGPLALIVALIILWQRNGSREVRRYADVARVVRTETLALDGVLSLVSQRLQDDRAAVAEQAQRLLSLADDTSTRLRSEAELLAKGVAELEKQSQNLDVAAGTARVDMGVLIADLPRVESQVHALVEAIRSSGLGAHEQAAGLEATLDALAARAREAEAGAGGAANRLSAQVSHLASATDVAAKGIEEASQRMSNSVEEVLERAAEAVETTRQGVAAQRDAINAMMESARSSADSTAAQVTQAFEDRMAALAAELDRLRSLLGEQDGIGADMIERIQRGLAGVEARFAELDETGRARTERLGEALGSLGNHAERTMTALNNGGTAATTLINRAETLKVAISACLDEISETLPAALDHLEQQATRSRETIEQTRPEVEQLHGMAGDAAQALDAARTALEQRRVEIDALSDAIDSRLAAAQGTATQLGDTVGEIDGKATKLADSTSPKLVDALIRVRETAGQAAERAREALGTIIPRSADALGEASRAALEQAVGAQVQGHIDRIGAAAQTAVEAAQAAAYKLEGQLAKIAETSAAVEGEIASGRAEVEEFDRDNFSRRVALLIDSLNSTSVDVTKLLSNDTSDSAWAAYLRGDRGVFTRRAVKLIDNGEAREISRHYEEDAEFRDQVNRYIHDFETLLRPILGTRDGSTLAVILLSSDMGKLYVALAQAIERLRS